MYASRDEQLAIWFSRIGYIGVIFIPVFVFHFIVIFLRVKIPKFILLFVYSLSIPFLILDFTNYFIKGMYVYFWGFYPTVGTAYKFYVIFFASVFIWSIFMLFKNLRVKSDKVIDLKRQSQIKYLLFAFVFATTSLVDYVQNYGLEIYPWGYISALGWIVIIAYAIVRHQFMDIEVIIKKTLVFAGLFVASYAVFASFAYLGSAVFENVVRNRWIAMVPSVLIIVLMLRPLESLLRNTTDKYLFQKKYDYRQLLRTFSDEVLTVLGLNMLVNLTVNKLAEVIKLDNASLILYDGEKETFRIAASVIAPESSVYEFSDNDDLISYVRENSSYVLLENSRRKKSLSAEMEKRVSELGADLLIPLTHRENMVGILSLGKKKSDEEFTQDDIDILLPLARTLSIAITNAQLFEELSEAQAQAAQREKMAVIGTLSAGINHEICNPLGIARGQCEMFLLNLKDGVYKDKNQEELLGKAREIMQKVINETDRATVITKKLSSFAKPAKGKIEDNVQVEKELNEVISLVEHDLKLDNIIIQKDIKEDLPYVSADRKQIQEIFFNIIRNAAQAIDGNGKITIRVSSANGKIHINIEDSGKGISKRHLDQIFNPFFTTKDPGKGAGLGLFIVKQIVERNNGHIVVQSELGKGTTFRLVFNAVRFGV